MSIASETTSYHLQVTSGYPVVTLQPALAEFPLGQVEEIGNELVRMLEQGRYRGLLVDITSLNYMGSAMVALVVRLWKAVKGEKASTNMVVAVSNNGVSEVLQLARLTDHWTVVATRDDGLKHLGIRATAAAAVAPSGGAAASAPRPMATPASGQDTVLQLLAVIGAAAAVVGAVLAGTGSGTVGMAIALVGGLVGFVGGILAVLTGSTAGKAIGFIAILVSAGCAAAGFALSRNTQQPAPVAPTEAATRQLDALSV